MFDNSLSNKKPTTYAALQQCHKKSSSDSNIKKYVFLQALFKRQKKAH